MKIRVLGILILCFFMTGCKKEEYHIEEDTLKANVLLMIFEEENLGQGITSFSTGFLSGTIIGQNGNSYEIITAKHIISDNVTSIHVATYNDDIAKPTDISDTSETEWRKRTFPEATIKHTDVEYDLSLLTVELEGKDVKVLEVADTNPKYKSWVTAMGNIYEKKTSRNKLTEGIIKSRKPLFDSFWGVKVDIIKHTAHTEEGNSGSSLLNGQQQVVGVCIGGILDDDGDYICGVAIPCEAIREFLEDC